MRFVRTGLFLALFFTPSLTLAATQSPLADQVEELKQQVRSLETSISELRHENREIIVHSERLASDLQVAKGLSTSKEFSKSLDSRTSALEEQIGKIKISGALTAIIQSSVNQRIHTSIQGAQFPRPNRFGQDSSDITDGAGSFDLYLESKISENSRVFANLEANSLNQVVAPSLAQPNGNTTFSTHLTAQNLDVLNVLELYLESQWYDNRLTTTIGKIDLTNYFNGNNIAWDDHKQFLGSIFVDDPSFYSVVPLNTIGARGQLNLGWGLTGQVAVISQDNSGQKLFNELFAIGELDYQTFFFFGREGNYRAWGYLKNINTINSFGAMTGKTSNALGGGISVDQKLTNKLSAFSRYGANESKLANSPSVSTAPFPAVNSSFSVGGQYQGLLPNRPDDMFGGAWGIIDPSDPPHTGLAERPNDEYFMEFYYNYKVTDKFHVTPLIQLMKHPNGDDDENWITIFGGRLFAEF